MEELVAELKRRGRLREPAVEKAFLSVDRQDFVLPEHRALTYEDYPLPIGHGQTISQPFTVAFMLDLLEPKPGEKILDVGSGSGWTTALLAKIAGKDGRVFGLEIIPELASFGQANLAKYGFPNASIRPAGQTLGLPEKAPFDKILVSAAGESYPKELISQLNPGGLMVIPIKNDIWKIKKSAGGEPEIEKFSGFAFVPLIEFGGNLGS